MQRQKTLFIIVQYKTQTLKTISMKDSKGDLIRSLSPLTFRTLGIIQLLGFLALFVSIFGFIWGDNSFSFKLLISSVFLILLIGGINHLIMRHLSKEVDRLIAEELEQQKRKIHSVKTSRFYQKLEELKNRSNEIKNN